MTGADAALLAGAGLAAGAINSVAGGGSLVSFPALIATGMPTLSANVTNLIAVTPGYVGGTLGYRDELRGQRARAQRLGVAVVLGALAGAAILLVAPDDAFDLLAPFLVLVACAALAFQPRLVRAARARHLDERASALPLIAFAGGIYGGYFGAGLGIMLLALLSAFVDDDLQRLNAIKGVLSLVVSVAAALVLAVLGPVRWGACAIIAVTSLLGGRAGVVLAKRLQPQTLRYAVASYGVVVATVLLAS
jgi:uncharacterized membrane protein YfcA